MFAGALLVVVTAQAAMAGAIFTPNGPPAGSRKLTGEGPDIFIILLDGYGRADTLASFGYDNEPFIAALRDRGFSVPEHTHSNYTKTWLTLATMFDLRHAAEMDLPSGTAPLAQQERALSRIFNESRGLDILRAGGYEIVATEDAFPELTLYSADRLLATGHLTAFEISVIRHSGGALADIFPDWLPGEHRAHIIDALRAVAEAADDSHSGPRFVWVHVMSPHPPFVFGEHPDTCFPQCSFFSPSATGLGLSLPAFESAFAKQTDVLNGLVLTTVDDIIASSASAPVIVLLSDHGVRLTRANPAEYFANFFAALTPNRPDLFPDDAAASGVLAVLLNAYLGASVPIPDPQPLLLSDERNVLALQAWPSP